LVVIIKARGHPPSRPLSTSSAGDNATTLSAPALAQRPLTMMRRTMPLTPGMSAHMFPYDKANCIFVIKVLLA